MVGVEYELKTSSYVRLSTGVFLAGLIIVLVAILSRESNAPGLSPTSAGPAPVLDAERSAGGRRGGTHAAASSTQASEELDLERRVVGGSSQRERDPRRAAKPVPDAARTVPLTRLPEGVKSLPEGTGSVTFMIQDASGQSLEEVSVALYWSQSEGVSGEATTGADGEVRFADLAAGTYSYRVDPPGRPSRTSTAPMRLREGDRKSLVLRLARSDLSISGRALNQNGEPVPGIEISAARNRYASSTTHEVLFEDKSGHSTRTNRDGSYLIQGLQEGEYRVHTTATERYLSIVRTVRAGLDSADLRLLENLRVHGTVTNERGEPLARVQVRQSAARGRAARSDIQGQYEIHLVPRTDLQEGYTLTFFLQGYEKESLDLRAAQLAESKELFFDIQLQELSEAALVSGVVETRRGERVQGVQVYLSSLQQGTHYQTPTDENGSFSIQGVKTDQDYHLRVLPRGGYRDYREGPLLVTRSGLWLDIVLEPLASGRLTGRMIDLDGNPIPHFRLWLVNTDAQHSSLPVSSDVSGYFQVDEAPEGQLLFDSRSDPMLRVSGVYLSGGEDQEVLLPLDWGEHIVDGAVLDDLGFPVAGAEVSLHWRHQVGALQSVSGRKTVTDERGLFQFSQIGPGVHRLDVRTSAHHAVSEEIDVGTHSGEVELLLEPISR